MSRMYVTVRKPVLLPFFDNHSHDQFLASHVVSSQRCVKEGLVTLVEEVFILSMLPSFSWERWFDY